jgi:hypothetical protein
MVEHQHFGDGESCIKIKQIDYIEGFESATLLFILAL